MSGLLLAYPKIVLIIAIIAANNYVSSSCSYVLNQSELIMANFNSNSNRNSNSNSNQVIYRHFFIKKNYEDIKKTANAFGCLDFFFWTRKFRLLIYHQHSSLVLLVTFAIAMKYMRK